jgi:hypothetical protein
VDGNKPKNSKTFTEMALDGKTSCAEFPAPSQNLLGELFQLRQRRCL